MKKILITNDDGVRAPALDLLRDRLSELGKVTIAAPEGPKNAMGNSITLHKPVRVCRISAGKYSVSGSPADCVRVGVLDIMGDSVDLVVSGINIGANLGDDVNYSGTVAGAREAALLEIPSLASSLVEDTHRNYEMAADITFRVAREVLENGFPRRRFLNLNIPDLPEREYPKGVCLCRLGVRIYERKVRERVDPAGRKYYWIIGERLDNVNEKGTDFEAIRRGYAALVPLGLDYTDHELAKELKTWNLS